MSKLWQPLVPLGGGILDATFRGISRIFSGGSRYPQTPAGSLFLRRFPMHSAPYWQA